MGSCFTIICPPNTYLQLDFLVPNSESWSFFSNSVSGLKMCHAQRHQGAPASFQSHYRLQTRLHGWRIGPHLLLIRLEKCEPSRPSPPAEADRSVQTMVQPSGWWVWTSGSGGSDDDPDLWSWPTTLANSLVTSWPYVGGTTHPDRVWCSVSISIFYPATLLFYFYPRTKAGFRGLRS